MLRQDLLVAGATRIAAALLATLLCAPLATAQYVQRVEPFGIPDRAAFDSRRGCFVAQCFVQDTWETFELHGTDWVWRQTGGAQPPQRFGFWYFDPARGRTVALETSLGPLSSEYWEWDGIAWHQLSAAVAPVPRYDATFAYYPARNRATMIGGFDRRGTALPEHWEWDGTDWVRLPGVVPPVRGRAAMCADQANNRLVLFGGFAGGSLVAETWTFDGAAWTRRTVPTAPSARFEPALAFDATRQRVVLCGGTDGLGTTLADEWEWDGSTWTLVTAAAPPGPIGSPGVFATSGFQLPSRPPFVATPSGIVLFQQLDFGARWTRNAAGWTRDLADRLPTVRRGTPPVFDPLRGVTLLFGGALTQDGATAFGDTWTWDGGWRRLRPALAPPARTDQAMAFDPARGEVVLFGGKGNGAIFGDTWTWDGSRWTQRQPPNAPSPRSGCSMAGHAAAGLVVLHGGVAAGSTFVVDTWTWDGIDWRLAAITGPDARVFPTFVEDRNRGVVVLAGGLFGTFFPRVDTWEWNGAAWQLRSATGAATASASCYDPTVGRVVQFADTRREWDGTSWTVVPAQEPLPSTFARAVFDERRARVLLFGREASSSIALAVAGPTPAQVADTGAGCGAPPPRLQLAGRGRIGEAGVHLVVDTARALAPGFAMIGWSGQGPTLGGCTLRVGSVAAILPLVADAAGLARLPLAVPEVPQLRGLEAYLQCAVVASNGPALGHVLTNGLRVSVGD